MPKRLEQRLRAEARRRGFGKARANAYIFGTLRKLGWRPRRQRRKGRRRHG